MERSWPKACLFASYSHSANVLDWAVRPGIAVNSVSVVDLSSAYTGMDDLGFVDVDDVGVTVVASPADPAPGFRRGGGSVGVPTILALLLLLQVGRSCRISVGRAGASANRAN